MNVDQAENHRALIKLNKFVHYRSPMGSCNLGIHAMIHAKALPCLMVKD